MTEYALYLESGPRRGTTMVHVLQLLGCIAQGPTTEAALDATPAAIHAFQRFLTRHGEAADIGGDFAPMIVQHVMEGARLGYGDPTPGFAPDFEPLIAEDLERYLRHMGWLQTDMLAQVRPLSPEKLTLAPTVGGRSLYRILEHVAESDAVYLRDLVGAVDGLAEALGKVREGPQGVVTALQNMWEITRSRLAALTTAERAQLVPHGQVTWTARRAIRRTLEHEWQHLQEIEAWLEEF